MFFSKHAWNKKCIKLIALKCLHIFRPATKKQFCHSKCNNCHFNIQWQHNFRVVFHNYDAVIISLFIVQFNNCSEYNFKGKVEHPLLCTHTHTFTKQLFPLTPVCVLALKLQLYGGGRNYYASALTTLDACVRARGHHHQLGRECVIK